MNHDEHVVAYYTSRGLMAVMNFDGFGIHVSRKVWEPWTPKQLQDLREMERRMIMHGMIDDL